MRMGTLCQLQLPEHSGISELWSWLGRPVGESGEKTALRKECIKGDHPAVPIWALIITVDCHDQVLAEVLPFSTGALDREDGQGVRSSLPGCVEVRAPFNRGTVGSLNPSSKMPVSVTAGQHQSSSPWSPVPPARPRGARRCLRVASAARGSGSLQTSPRPGSRALWEQCSPSPSGGPSAHGPCGIYRADSCTSWVGVRARATDSTSTRCTRRRCEQQGCSLTTTMWSPSGPEKPNSAMAAVPSVKRRCL